MKKYLRTLCKLLCCLALMSSLTACDTLGGYFFGNNNGAGLGLGTGYSF